MALFKSKTVQPDPLDQAIDKGRNVRGFLSGLVNDLDEANSLHNNVVADAEDTIQAAAARKEIAQQETAANAALATNLRSLGLAPN